MPRRFRQIGALLFLAVVVASRPAHACPTSGTAPPVAWRPLRAGCLPASGAVYASRWPALRRLEANVPVEVRGEAEFVSRLGCASGVDWRKERLVLLLLEVGSMDAIRLEQVVDSGTTLAVRVRVTCGAGYDDGVPGLAGSHVLFGIVVPATSSVLDVKYRYVNVETSKYSSVVRDCGKIPRSSR